MTRDEAIARLMAVPALPRGERLAWVHRARAESRQGVRALGFRTVNMLTALAPNRLIDTKEWRRLAAPLRRAREERRAARERIKQLEGALADVLGPPCEKAGRWCLTHRTNDCAADDARAALAGGGK
jgi:hypothetical protein